ncbi:TIGR02186 family protein [Aquicoccus sp. G2-2]|uniref:TIGR02186 family protein n=1 Tax=Aquicoccus sp. G2-2 TaxID=3092120 RepID=UPI002AE052E9|nr:TIGR02186 family protein [Aquicoccus sp. G2-2]MEA1112406.1 TIGR02186 family protein [Aquicoccus sp. G2-2]
MFRYFAAFFAILTFTHSSGLAEEVVLGLSQSRVAITANFDGSEILIFGGVKREAPPPTGAPLEVVIVIEGPSVPLTVRRKAKKYGIWINADSVSISSAPAFYSVSTSAPFNDAINHTEDLRHHISVPRAIRSIGAASYVSDPEAFTDAVIRIRQENGLYQFNENAVQFEEQTLFRTTVHLPSNLTEGNYKTRIFLTRNGNVVSHFETTIGVHKVGLEQFLYSLSHERPLIYGLLSLAIAIAAGWGASAFFRMFGRS